MANKNVKKCANYLVIWATLSWLSAIATIVYTLASDYTEFENLGYSEIKIESVMLF